MYLCLHHFLDMNRNNLLIEIDICFQIICISEHKRMDKYMLIPFTLLLKDLIMINSCNPKVPITCRDVKIIVHK